MERNLRKIGLLGPVTVNRGSGNLVSGHQRLACIDAIEGSPVYLLDVAMCDLTPKQEREQCVFMNNAAAQGAWDAEALKALLPGLDLDATGWDPIDLQLAFPEDPEIATIFGADPAPEKKPKPRDGVRLDKIKADRKGMGKRMADRDDTEFYAVVVFQNREQREAFCAGLGVDSNDRYLDGKRVAFRCGVTLPETQTTVPAPQCG